MRFRAVPPSAVVDVAGSSSSALPPLPSSLFSTVTPLATLGAIVALPLLPPSSPVHAWSALVLCALLVVFWVPPLRRRARAWAHPRAVRLAAEGVPAVARAQRLAGRASLAAAGAVGLTVSVPFYGSALPAILFAGFPDLCVRTVALMAFCLYVGNALKDLCCSPRPAAAPGGRGRVRVVGAEADEARRNALEYGFPSSHVMNTVGMYLYALLYFADRDERARARALPLALGVALWTLFVARTRMQLGVHTPLDLWGGALAGALVTSGFWYLAPRVGRAGGRGAYAGYRAVRAALERAARGDALGLFRDVGQGAVGGAALGGVDLLCAAERSLVGGVEGLGEALRRLFSFGSLASPQDASSASPPSPSPLSPSPLWLCSRVSALSSSVVSSLSAPPSTCPSSLGSSCAAALLSPPPPPSLFEAPPWSSAALPGCFAALLSAALLLRFHPTPARHTPSLEFSASFAGVAFGVSASSLLRWGADGPPARELAPASLWVLARRIALGLPLAVACKEATRAVLRLVVPRLFGLAPQGLRRLWQPPLLDVWGAGDGALLDDEGGYDDQGIWGGRSRTAKKGGGTGQGTTADETSSPTSPPPALNAGLPAVTPVGPAALSPATPSPTAPLPAPGLSPPSVPLSSVPSTTATPPSASPLARDDRGRPWDEEIFIRFFAYSAIGFSCVLIFPLTMLRWGWY